MLVTTGFCSCEKDSDTKGQNTPEQNTYVRVGNILISDRNVGAPMEGVALNYANDTSHPDRRNSELKGGYYS